MISNGGVDCRGGGKEETATPPCESHMSLFYLGVMLCVNIYNRFYSTHFVYKLKIFIQIPDDGHKKYGRNMW
jgi:hypothetical protein